MIHLGDSLGMYGEWGSPDVIMSDGPYGLGKFDTDPASVGGLEQFYEPHIMQWARHAGNHTTLWFWNTEIGWATMHPVLERHGWRYVGCSIWNKGIGHIAGNVNTGTIRRFPVVTEMCAQYARDGMIRGMPIREWLRHEWRRAGLPFCRANQACGVANAASRKYLALDDSWYFPPPRMLAMLAAYANRHGRRAGRPYLSLDGTTPATAGAWSRMRPVFRCRVGVTNVWDEPPLHGPERVRRGLQSLHPNQKPLGLVTMLVESSSEPQGMVWEPFGGLCPAAVAAHRTGRRYNGAEINAEYHGAAVRRLARETARAE